MCIDFRGSVTEYWFDLSVKAHVCVINYFFDYHLCYALIYILGFYVFQSVVFATIYIISIY